VLLTLAFSTVLEARVYQWTDPNTGTAYLSGEPPGWYRTRQAGPRVLVYEDGKLVDDTEWRTSLEREKVLRAQALKETEARKRAEEERRAEAARLAAEKAALEEEKATPKPGEEDAVAIFRALISEWDKRSTEEPPAARSPR